MKINENHLRDFMRELQGDASDLLHRLENAVESIKELAAYCEDEPAEQKTRLADLAPGTHFMYGGVEWVKLNEENGGALSLTAEIVTNRAFDEEDCGDWRGSTLREWLNAGAFRRKLENPGAGFYTTLLENSAEQDAFLPIVSDLTADDGMTDYGTAEDAVALLSCDLYRKFRNIIPAVDEWYWTLTAWTCNAANSYNVRNVNTSGALNNYNADNGHGGVRPLCNFDSEILVSVCEEGAE